MPTNLNMVEIAPSISHQDQLLASSAGTNNPSGVHFGKVASAMAFCR
jgi:hypothetical protein